MSGSNLTTFAYIPENSLATPGLWNSVFSILSANDVALNSASVLSGGLSLGTQGLTISVPSGTTDYIFLNDSSNARSNYIIGSFNTGTADGLNIFDASGNTMIVSFSKQSARFFVPVVGPIFDIGGANTITVNAGAFVASSALSQIQAAISAASNAGLPIRFVYVPGTLQPYDPTKITFDKGILMEHEGQLSSRQMRNTVTNNGDTTDYGQLLIYSQLASFQADTYIMASASSNTNITGDYDVHIGSEYTNGRVGTGVLILDTDIKVSAWSNVPGGRPHGMFINQNDNSAVMEFPVSGGVVNMKGVLGGGNSATSNLVLRNGAAAGSILFQNAAGSTNIVLIGDNGLLTLTNRLRGIDATNGNPMYAFTSDANTGWYRSATSTVGLSGAAVAVPDGTALWPSHNFSSESSLGFYRSGTSHLGLSYGALSLPDGTGQLPPLTFSSESSLGFWRSANSVLRMSYGTLWTVGDIWCGSVLSGANGLTLQGGDLNVNAGNISLTRTAGTDGVIGMTQASTAVWQLKNEATTGQWVLRDNLNTTNVASALKSYFSFSVPTLAIDGTSGQTASYAFKSEKSLGWFRSAASVMALTYGGLGIKAGTNASCGTAVLGSNGSVNVANTYVAAGDLIFLTDQTPGGTLGDLELGGIRAGSGFTIQSTSVTDTSTVAWLIIRPN